MFLHFQDFGTYESRPYQEVLAYSLKLDVEPLEWYYPGGESFPQAGQRMVQIIEVSSTSNILELMLRTIAIVQVLMWFPLDVVTV